MMDRETTRHHDDKDSQSKKLPEQHPTDRSGNADSAGRPSGDQLTDAEEAQREMDRQLASGEENPG